MSMLWDMFLIKVCGVVRMRHHISLSEAYLNKVEELLRIRDEHASMRAYLEQLKVDTPHKHIRMEINNVLHQTDNTDP